MSEIKNNSDEQKMTGHSYDGIAECDNPLPRWWVWTFILTIIFAAFYYAHYELGSGPTLKEELEVAMTEINKTKQVDPSLNESEEFLEKQMQGDGLLAVGITQFNTKCAVCHGAELQGLIGPNLTDKYWIHGKGSRMDLAKVIREGVPDKGMPSWAPVLTNEEIYGVVAYIFSKKGSNPPNPKAPQGELAN